MKLSTLSGKMKLLSVNTNAKTVKSSQVFEQTLTAILYLSPHDLAGYGTVCANASDGCKATCLYTAGRGKFSNVQQARTRKTKLFFEDNQTFKEQLTNDLTLFLAYCKQENLKPYVRLNGTSDIDWQKVKLNDQKQNCLELFPEIQFYDYTKDYKRTSNHPNYHITYSWSETVSDLLVANKIANGDNIAVVFDSVPTEWKTFKVIDGDESDLRPKDDKGVIVGLKAKGLAKTIQTDFVIKTLNI